MIFTVKELKCEYSMPILCIKDGIGFLDETKERLLTYCVRGSITVQLGRQWFSS